MTLDNERKVSVPELQWVKSPMTIVQGYKDRHPEAPIGPPAMWAAWAVEALHYLDDLDQAQTHYPTPVQGHHSDIIDIAHVRCGLQAQQLLLLICVLLH